MRVKNSRGEYRNMSSHSFCGLLFNELHDMIKKCKKSDEMSPHEFSSEHIIVTVISFIPKQSEWFRVSPVRLYRKATQPRKVR